MIELLNCDCMEYMATVPDKYFDLAVVDVPYGIGENGDRNKSRCKLAIAKDYKAFAGGDVSAPEKTYFDELKRITKNQIIWGGNYFLDYLGATRCFCIWDKMNGTNPMADAELAWASFESSVRMFRMHHFSAGYERKIHPTQKPVALYEWLLTNYAKKGQRVFDSHLGSASSAIAAHYFGVDFVGCELDKDYFEAAKARFDMATKQLAMSI